jgi:Spy/CpxP family protein refolding chaperone
MAVLARTRLLGFALLAVTFVAGALSGAALERVLGADEPPRPERSGEGRRRAYVIDGIEMSAGQRAAIDSILDRRSERMRVVWKEVEPHMEAITDSTRADIMAVLTPEQRAEYEHALQERRRERRERRERQDREGDGEG